MRWLAGLACLLLAFAAAAGDTIHARGDFSFVTGPEPAFVERAEVPAQWDPGAPGHDEPRWRYWWYDAQSDRRGGIDQRYVEHVYEPRAVSMLGEAGRFQVSFNPGYETLAFHRVELRRDGRWLDRLAADRISLARRESGFENDLADGNVTALVVLDDVRVGDIVRVSYTITGSNPVLAGQVADWNQLAWRNPVLGNRLRVLFEPGVEPRVYRELTDAEATVTRRDDAVEVVVSSTATAAVVDEGDYPPWYQPYPVVQVAPARSWADVVAWALPLYPAPGALPAGLEARVREWARLREPLDRVTAATRAVQDEVRYFGVEMGDNTHRPSPPALTWERRYGDCKDKSYLLAAILRRLGYRAEPALASVHRGRAVAGFVPSASNFDHVIVRAQVGGETLWIDPTLTDRGGRAGDADLSAYGKALPLVAGSAALVDVDRPGADPGGVSVRERHVPAGTGGSMRMEIHTEYRGAAADNTRRAFTTERRDELSRRYADYYRRRFGEIEVLGEPEVRDDRDANVITMTERYLLEDPFDEEGSVRAFDTYADTLDAPSVLPAVIDRKGPVVARRPGAYRHQIEVQVPDGWTPRFNGSKGSGKASGMGYAHAIGVADGVANLSYQLDVEPAEVVPADVAVHVAGLRQLREGLSARLRYQPAASMVAAERRRRLEALLKESIEEDVQ